MLEIENFVQAITVMTKCLPTAKVDDRIDGLYHFFKNEAYSTVKAAAEACANEQERFPTPAVFSRYVLMNRVKQVAQTVSCEFCGGVGTVRTFRRSDRASYVFRCHCTNAAKYQKFPLWTADAKNNYELSDANVFQDLHENPEKYARGLTFLSDTLKDATGTDMPNPIKEKLKDRIQTARRMQKDT